MRKAFSAEFELQNKNGRLHFSQVTPAIQWNKGLAGKTVSDKSL